MHDFLPTGVHDRLERCVVAHELEDRDSGWDHQHDKLFLSLASACVEVLPSESCPPKVVGYKCMRQLAG